MPNKVAGAKAIRQDKKRFRRNLSVKNKVKGLMTQTQKAIGAKEEKQATDFLGQAVKSLDKALQHGVMKKGSVARKKSSLMRAFQKAGYSIPRKEKPTPTA